MVDMACSGVPLVAADCGSASLTCIEPRTKCASCALCPCRHFICWPAQVHAIERRIEAGEQPTVKSVRVLVETEAREIKAFGYVSAPDAPPREIDPQTIEASSKAATACGLVRRLLSFASIIRDCGEPTLGKLLRAHERFRRLEMCCCDRRAIHAAVG